ncbi:MAG: hypothetical protein LC785_03970 [Acidobacteria bacterium]|nr:hypothetical protein [Acidobacteriota bacterium]MCA1641141.1 hypothetical protein [Acidobacteriota bacterium]
MLSLTPLSVSAATRAAALNNAAMPVATYAGGVTVPVAGTTSKGGKFTGNFNIKQFSVVGDKIVAVGTLTGTIQNSVGNVIGTVLKTIQMIVAFKGASCDILHLELGPLDLDLLGLQVHLDKIVLDIDADPSGGLLGQLLCAVANLLNTGGLLADIAALLNQILAIL